MLCAISFQAVNLLNSMNWNIEGNACFACMVLIMNYLLRLPLSPEREGSALCFIRLFEKPVLEPALSKPCSPATFSHTNPLNISDI